MIFIKIFGADISNINYHAKRMEKGIKTALNLDEPISIIANETLFIHEGQEQTSFNLLCEILAPSDLKPQKEKIAQAIGASLKWVTVHSRLVFQWFDRSDSFDFIDRECPEYLKPGNMVTADDRYGDERQDEDGEGDDPDDVYLGNVFEDLDKFVADHPEMSPEEATLAFYATKNKNK